MKNQKISVYIAFIILSVGFVIGSLSSWGFVSSFCCGFAICMIIFNNSISKEINKK